MSSEDRLEEALSAYNTKISNLERLGDSDELLEAYINRGTVLMMMEFFTAAESDFEEAVESILIRERRGIPVDLGLFIRAYENRGQLSCDVDNPRMLEDYKRIIERLPELRNGTRYFTTKDIVIMCINCAEDLLDCQYGEYAIPFLDKALEVLKGKHDAWAENRFMDVCGIKAEALKTMRRFDESIGMYDDAIKVGERLLYEGNIDDPYLLTLCYMYRGDVYDALRDDENALKDHIDACGSLEEMVNNGASENKKLLTDLCQDIASRLMDMGRIEQAEKYLLKGMRYGLPEMEEAIGALGIPRPDDEDDGFY